MRIISGKAKGKKILMPLDKKTRPLKDMVKESIFNILRHSSIFKKDVKDSYILDLFSGIGSFGLEAISRGAKKVIFYEDYKPAADLLKKNVKNLNFESMAEIRNINIYNNNSLKNLNFKFNIVFIDPPFNDKNLVNLIIKVSKSGAINSNSLIIIHRHKKTVDKYNVKFKILREEIYGSSKIVFGQFSA